MEKLSVEDAHFDAGFELQDSAIEWAIDHRETLEESAGEGCMSSVTFVDALARYFATWEILDKAETDAAFDEIADREGGTDEP